MSLAVQPMRVVMDTNVWISSLLIPDSASAQAVDEALSQSEVMVSDATIEELADVLSCEKFDPYLSLDDREYFLRHLLQVTTMASVISEVTDCTGPSDNRFLALALDSESDSIVSGDADLLSLNPWRGIQIVSPRDFLALKQQS